MLRHEPAGARGLGLYHRPYETRIMKQLLTLFLCV